MKRSKASGKSRKKKKPQSQRMAFKVRVGTIPVARAVGGLVDTIDDFSDGEGTGFLFSEYTPEAFIEAIERALEVYADSSEWRALMKNAMQKDFSCQRKRAAKIPMKP